MGLASCMEGGLGLSHEEAVERTRRGLDHIGKYDYDSAERDLRGVPDALEPGTPEWDRAAFGLASALRYVLPAKRADIEHSRELFRQIAAESGNPNLRALSLMELAREMELINYPGDKPDLAGARELYQKVAADFEGQPFAEEATMRLANSYFADTDNPEGVDKGIAILTAYLPGHPGGPLEVVMWQQLGLAYDRLKHDPANSLAAYEKARELGFALPVKKDQEMWKMSQLAEEAGDLRAAAELYRRLLVETPRTAVGTLARRRLVELTELHPEWGMDVPPQEIYGAQASPAPEAHTPSPAGQEPDAS